MVKEKKYKLTIVYQSVSLLLSIFSDHFFIAVISTRGENFQVEFYILKRKKTRAENWVVGMIPRDKAA